MDHLFYVEECERQKCQNFLYFHFWFSLREGNSQVAIKWKLSEVKDEVLIPCTIQ